jgi:hypothetical protein
VNAPPSFDFSLANGGNQTVVQGQSGSNTITATLVSGTSQSVSLSASGLPTGAAAAFSAGSCSPTCSSTLTLTTSASTPTGSSTITVTGVAGSLSHTTAFTLTVNSAPPPASTITYVQGNYAVPQSPQSPVNVTFSAAQNAGDLNVVVVGWNDSTATVTAVTDTRGNAYKLAVGPTIQAGVASQSIYYASNIAPAAAGVNTVTVSFSSPARYPDIRILEYQGADPNNPVDVTAANSGNSATSSSGSATTTNATDLIVGANYVQTYTSGPGSGFTSRLLTSPDSDLAEDQMVSAAGSYSATAPLTSSAQWIMQMVAFRTAGNTTPPPPTAADWTGAGKIAVSGGYAEFGFKVIRNTNGSLAGRLSFYNAANGFGFYSTTILTLSVTGNQAVFTGTGSESVSGGPWSGPFNFTVTVQDVEPSGDTFRIDISDPSGTTAGSTTTPIIRGSIEQNY